MSWQYTDPGLAPRAHHVEDLRSEAARYRLLQDLMSRRRRQRWAHVRAWMTWGLSAREIRRPSRRPLPRVSVKGATEPWSDGSPNL